MIARFTRIAGLVAAVGIAACVDMSAPKNAPASISAPQLPALFVVRGDVMRDSAGNPARPALLLYDANGAVTTGFTPTFFLTDSNAAAHFNSEGVLAGDRLGTVHLVAQVGNLQTTALVVAVTVAPTKLVGPAKTDTVRAPVGQDTTASAGFQPAAVTVRGAGDTAVAGVVVRYSVIHVPESSSSTQPAAYLANDQGAPSLADTSDATGTASRRVVVISTRLKDQAVLSGQKTDSVVVEARATYRGAPLSGSPVRMAFPVKVTFALK